MNIDSKIYIAGHRGLVGSAIMRELERRGYLSILTRSRSQLNLLDPQAVEKFFSDERPEYVFFAAAKVGGILANSNQPASFLWENLRMETNILDSAWRFGVKKLLFLGSSCIYPKLAPQPLKEEYLLTGPLEPTNEWYAVAKIAGIKMCQAFRRQYGCNFISAMPTNMYGPNDNYDLQTSHVLPALIRKFHEAKMNKHHQVVCWGSGNPKREFLHSDDLAKALLFLMDNYDAENLINVGFGSDITIRDLAMLVAKVVGFGGEIIWDASKPDGTPRKLMDSSRIFNLGWKPAIDLPTGVAYAYNDFIQQFEK